MSDRLSRLSRKTATDDVEKDDDDDIERTIGVHSRGQSLVCGQAEAASGSNGRRDSVCAPCARPQYNAVYIPMELCFQNQLSDKHPAHIVFDFFGEPTHAYDQRGHTKPELRTRMEVSRAPRPASISHAPKLSIGPHSRAVTLRPPLCCTVARYRPRATR